MSACTIFFGKFGSMNFLGVLTRWDSNCIAKLMSRSDGMAPNALPVLEETEASLVRRPRRSR